MQKKFAYFIALLGICCCTACYKDKGNYNYHPINEVAVSQFDTVQGYLVYIADTLKVSPVVTGTLDKEGTAGYSYEWSYETQDFVSTVISTEKNLRYAITLLPGNYSLRLKVTDNASGVLYHFRANLQVSTAVYEGYLVLNEVNGHSRLDMLSYQTNTQQFTQITDVLQKMASSLPQQGSPVNIFCMQSSVTATADGNSYKIYLSSSSGTNNLNSETFDYEAKQNISYEMIGDVPQDFTASNFFGTFRFGVIPTMYMVADNNVYIRTNSYPAFPYVPLNAYAGALPFKASPYIVGDPNYCMIFNMDKRTFTRTPSFSANYVEDMAPGLNFPTGKDLVYMEMSYSGVIHAILKDPSTGAYSIIRFLLGTTPTYNDVITATDFDKATHYAMSPDRGYLFYSVGGKVYEYDLSLKTAKLMLDRGSEEVTYLAFPNFFYRTTKTTYTSWANLLNIGWYNAAGTAGANGTLEQYNVPQVNGQITLANQWTGFGKITSIAYRERR
ncbi:PKD-like family protein [Filimonas lacunae]|uniref:PKD-like family protein n=2 Tax=Filimonas lacunae TaxID=477680 RepID=A0A1N7NGF7_9BACT|nr:PKD-like family protein [Filimonas lacunae]